MFLKGFSDETQLLATDRVGQVRQNHSSRQYFYSSPVRKNKADIRKVQPHMNQNALPVPLPSQVYVGRFWEFF